MLLSIWLPLLPPADWIAPAMADDDDDDDGWSGFFSGDDDDDDRPPPRVSAPPAARPPPPPAFIADEIVVGALSEAELALLLADGFPLIDSATVPLVGGIVARFSLPDGLDLAGAHLRVAAIAPAALVDLNHLYRPVEMPCRAGDCLAFEMIGWPVPPDRCVAAETIGIIDTVVNVEHEALAGQALEIVSVLGEAETRSAAIHGTAIATLLVGSAASRTPGLLPDARVVAVEAFHGEPAGDAADVFKVVRGLDALQQRDVKVANLSFAGPDNDLLERAVGASAASGMIVVAAAGNAGPLAPPAFPAAYPGVVAVTAVDRDREAYRQAGRGGHVTFSAPGVGVWTAASISGGRFRSGTSYAAPFVSAAVALAAAAAPGRSAAELVESLAASTLDLGAPGRDPVYGWGLIAAPPCPVVAQR